MTAQKHTLPTTRTLASPQAIAAHRQALSATGAMSVNLFMLSGVLTDLKVHPGLRLMELRFELTDAASREAYNAREGSHADSNRTIFAHARIYDPAPMADAQTLVRGEPFHMLGFLEPRFIAVIPGFFVMCCLMANMRRHPLGYWASVLLHAAHNALALLVLMHGSD